MALQSPLINVMIGAARKASPKLRRDFGEVEHLQVSQKGPADFVTVADTRTENMLRRELERARPEFGFLLEAAGEIATKDGRHRWIIDPLDGTLNFIHGIPHFAISIALERDGEIVAGVIYEPINDQMFWAEVGQGAHLNSQRLRVSGRGRMDHAVIATGIPYTGQGGSPAFIPQIEAFMPACAGLRCFGSAALDLAYVAAGRFDGYWESGLKAWDMAAGIVLVREAGGYVSELDGGANMIESGGILAANDKLHGEMMALLKKTA